MTVRSPTPLGDGSAPTDDARSAAALPPLADHAVIAQLLALAGPSASAALVRQISADLAEVRAKLSTAVTERDDVALRRASHVLVSLAGTIGAAGTCAMARDLTGSAVGAACDRLDRLAAQLLSDIDRLSRELAEYAPGSGR